MHGGGVEQRGRHRRQPKAEAQRCALRLGALRAQIAGEDFRCFLDAGAGDRDRDAVNDELAPLAIAVSPMRSAVVSTIFSQSRRVTVI
jgi:hypothetical protein